MDETLVARYPELERSHFWWQARRIVIRRLVSDLGIESPSILDVGCGSGVTARMMADTGATVVGVDIEPRNDLTTEAAFTYLHGDFLTLTQHVGEHDVVLGLDAIEHFESEWDVLNAMHANTKPGGIAIVTVPAYDWLWSSHDDDNHHYRRYTRRRLKRALEDAGFSVERVGYLFAALLFPKTIVAAVERRRTRPFRVAGVPGMIMNRLAAAYFRTEVQLALHFQDFLPVGTSVVGVARKHYE
jgi:SAM-dependent methyltransferase